MRLFINATVHTMTPASPTADCVLVGDDGRIAFVGARDDANVPAGTPTVDLGGATLLPGFNDAHIHIWKLGLLLTRQVDVRRAKPEAMPALVGALRDHAVAQPDGWILGRGYDEAALAESRHPTATDLDAVSADRPLALTRICGHIMALNSRALELAGITAATPDPAGGVIERDAGGNPTGVLKESAMALVNRVIPAVTDDDMRAAILATGRHQLTLGITSATDPLVTPDHLRAYRALDADGALVNRVNTLAVRRLDGGTETLPLPEKHVSDRLRVDSVKFFADGGLSGATAALAVNYKLTGDNGVLRYETDDMLALMREAHVAGYRIGTHAIGDRALDQVLGCYEALHAEHPSDIRHRVEHLGLPSAEHLARAKAIDAIAVPQTVFLPALGRNFRRYLPDDYLPRTYPVRAMMDAGLTVALSSDAPVVPDDNPLLGAWAAVTRADHAGDPIAPEQAITVAEALHAYTVGGAVASGDADNRGQLAPGMWADMVALDADPLAVPVDALLDIGVQRTILGGEVVYEA
ncbi:MAG: amidohydrolase [Chloroflexota bacterium]